MANAPADAGSGRSVPATTRRAVDGNGHDEGAAEAGPPTAVAAHVLLNSVSTVLLGAATLDESWEVLSTSERRTIAARIHLHMIEVAERVRDMVIRPPAPRAPVTAVRRGPAQVRVRVQGRVDGATGGYLRDRTVEAGVEPGCEEVLLDLYAVTSLDAEGLAAVLQVHRELMTAGVRLAVIDAPPPVRRSLRAAGLGDAGDTSSTIDLGS